MDLIEKAAAKLERMAKESSEETSADKKEAKLDVAPGQQIEQPGSLIEKSQEVEEVEITDTAHSFHTTEKTLLEDEKPAKFLSMKLNLDHLRAAGMVIPDSSRSQIKEEYRHIKRPLLVNAAGKGTLKSNRGNMIMVTSTNPNEGKTFSAINLAMSIAAERDKTVLLVDCDVLKPSVAKFFGLNNPKGLTDYLNDKAGLNEIIVRTDLPTFRIIPAGLPHHLSNELLASEKMEALMKELSTRYPDRIVILDSPPLLSTTEAAILSSQVGQIVVVVEADKTKQDELQEAIDRLPLNSEVAIGVVLNKSQRHMDGSYYGYGSSYGYS